MQGKKKKKNTTSLNWKHPGSGDYFKGVHLFALFIEQWSSAFNISLWGAFEKCKCLDFTQGQMHYNMGSAKGEWGV